MNQENKIQTGSQAKQEEAYRATRTQRGQEYEGCYVYDRNNHRPSQCFYRKDKGSTAANNRDKHTHPLTRNNNRQHNYINTSSSRREQSSIATRRESEERREYTFNVEDSCYSADGSEIKILPVAWTLKSGTSHMSPNIEWMDSIRDFQIEINLTECGKTMKSGAMGNINIVTEVNSRRANIRMTKVLYVTSLRSNLLSMSKLNKQGIKVLFMDRRADIVGPNEEIIAQVHEVNGIYILRTKMVRDCRMSTERKLINDPSSKLLWHRVHQEQDDHKNRFYTHARTHARTHTRARAHTDTHTNRKMGCLAYFHISRILRSKLNLTAQRGIFVVIISGIQRDKESDPENHKIYDARSVIFDESKTGAILLKSKKLEPKIALENLNYNNGTEEKQETNDGKNRELRRDQCSVQRVPESKGIERNFLNGRKQRTAKGERNQVDIEVQRSESKQKEMKQTRHFHSHRLQISRSNGIGTEEPIEKTDARRIKEYTEMQSLGDSYKKGENKDDKNKISLYNEDLNNRKHKYKRRLVVVGSNQKSGIHYEESQLKLEEKVYVE